MWQNSCNYLGKTLAAYLTRPSRDYSYFSVATTTALRAILRPADVVLIEGNTRISTAIKYLSQSTWSHACLYVGDALNPSGSELIEADLVDGVIAVPLEKYANFNVRICRPIGLTESDQKILVSSVLAQLGKRYDLKNIIDLMRYLLPTPPVPIRMRRQLIAFGSGDPTRAICSTLIAQAFQTIRFPILPIAATGCIDGTDGSAQNGDCVTTRHFTHFTPRDFDLSPYFTIVKPLQETGFQYKQLRWRTES